MKILFKNAKVLNFDSQNGYIQGFVAVQDNKITYVGTTEPNDQFERVVDVNGNILMPGFVNCHAHSPMTILRGIKDDVDLQSWLLDYVMPMEEKICSDDIYWGEMLAIAESVKGGITCMEENYYHATQIAKAITKSGMRARISLGQIIKDEINTEKFLDNELEKLNEYKTDLITKSVFVHSIYSMNEDKILGMIDFARKHDLPLGIHLSETLTEVGDCTTKNKDLTPPQYLENLGFFDRPNALCAHCVHMDKDDLQILADYDANIVVNPASNIKLASGIAPIYAMQKKGINVCIGTDSVASNNNLDMFKEMYLTACLPKVNLYMPNVLLAQDVVKMATVNGAKALNINSGEIKVGKLADLIIVDTSMPHMHPFSDIYSMLVYSAKSSDVIFTMVNGKILYENGKFNIGENISDIYAHVDKIRARIN